MPAPKNSTLFGLAAIAASAAAVLWFLRQRLGKLKDLPIWQGTLAAKHGPQKANQMSEQIRQRYAILLTQQKLPQNPALRRHATESILPGLALYQVLLEEYNGDQPTALAEIDEVFRAWTLKKSRLLMAPLKWVPNPFQLFKVGFHARMKAFPVEGWDFETVEDSAQCVAFNTTRCFYLNTLASRGAPELTASFCKGDDVMAELLPPAVRFVRTKTLGRGNSVCDFQYCRIDH